MKYFLLTLSLLSFSSCKPSADLHRSVLDESPTIKTGLPFYDGADLTPKWPSRGVVAAPAFHKVQPFQFLDQDGRKVTAQTFDKKIYVANFFFTSCGGICPRMIENMRMIQDEFEDDASVVLLSHSVTPEVDTVSALKSYAEVKGVKDDRWYLATGRRAAIYKTARQSYFADSAPSFGRGKNDFLHTEKFFLVDKERRIRGVYNGTRLMDIRRLIVDIRTLQRAYGSDGSPVGPSVAVAAR